MAEVKTLLSLVIDENGDLAIHLRPDKERGFEAGHSPSKKFLKVLVDELRSSEQEHQELATGVENVIDDIEEKMDKGTQPD